MADKSSINIPSVKPDRLDKLAKFLIEQQDCKLFGPYVYRRLVSGREVKDIHAAVKPDMFIDPLQSEFQRINIKRTDGLNINLTAERCMERRQNTFSNVLIFTKDGLKHRDNTLSIEKQDSQVQYAVQTLQRGEVCPWGHPTKEERKFFADYDVNKSRCEEKGFRVWFSSDEQEFYSYYIGDLPIDDS